MLLWCGFGLDPEAWLADDMVLIRTAQYFYKLVVPVPGRVVWFADPLGSVCNALRQNRLRFSTRAAHPMQARMRGCISTRIDLGCEILQVLQQSSSYLSANAYGAT